MDEVMLKNAAEALTSRLKDLLDASMTSEITLSRAEALLAQGFAQSVADLLTPARRYR